MFTQTGLRFEGVRAQALNLLICPLERVEKKLPLRKRVSKDRFQIGFLYRVFTCGRIIDSANPAFLSCRTGFDACLSAHANIQSVED